MEQIITNGTFVEYLTYFLKIGIYANKGTTNEDILEKSIKIFNKFKTIETTKKISDNDQSLVRKCLKRLNLILKLDDDYNPLDVKIKNHQANILRYKVHSSISNDSLDEMIIWAEKDKFHIITGIPMTFMLKEGCYQELLWQHVRLLFYISQILISNTKNPTSLHEEVSKDAFLNLEKVLLKISDLEEETKVNKIMSLDKFLNSKLLKTGINDKSLGEARQEIKGLFQKKGLGDNISMNKMIDAISGKMGEIDFTKGNIIQSVMGIAQHVSNEVQTDFQNDPEGFRGTLGALTDVFKELISDPNNNDIPNELKEIVGAVMDVTNGDENQIVDKIENLVGHEGFEEIKAYIPDMD
uniref:Uncharacterized protein n=1 Tax=viral metagenome TaxID=1070528 RepID=A0A6C0LR20_9ZZZZ